MRKTKAQLEAELMDAKSDSIAWHQYAKRLEDKMAVKPARQHALAPIKYVDDMGEVI